MVFNATEQEGILSAVEDSGIEVLGQTNAETSNIKEVIELLKEERSREVEGDQRDPAAVGTKEFEHVEMDESMYEGRTCSCNEKIIRYFAYRLVYICMLKLSHVISRQPWCGGPKSREKLHIIIVIPGTKQHFPES